MPITTYTELQAALQSWLWDRADVAAQIPTFIQLAEAEMNRRLTTRLKVTQDLITLDDELIDQPAGFAGVLSFKLIDAPYTELKFTTPDGLTQLTNRLATSDGEHTAAPTHYAIVGDLFQVMPPPDGTYRAVITYRVRIPPLSASNASNWILENHPDAYLYGALLHAESWLRHFELVPTYREAFAQVLADIQAADLVEAGAPNLSMNPSTLGVY
jgi:hypothetical protein